MFPWGSRTISAWLPKLQLRETDGHHEKRLTSKKWPHKMLFLMCNISSIGFWGMQYSFLHYCLKLRPILGATGLQFSQQWPICWMVECLIAHLTQNSLQHWCNLHQIISSVTVSHCRLHQFPLLHHSFQVSQNDVLQQSSQLEQLQHGVHAKCCLWLLHASEMHGLPCILHGHFITN